MTKYDSIAKEYAAIGGNNIIRKYIITPTFLSILGDVEGLSAIDLACGDGIYARELKRLRASKVVGVDISEKMLELARTEEEKSPLGIEYMVHDVTDLPAIGAFDIATATFLLHYSRTKSQLRRMCENIYRNLKPGGRFAGINSNSDCDFTKQLDTEYGVTDEVLDSMKEGYPVRITLHHKGTDVSFTNYMWKKETYEKALDGAGFSGVEWMPPIVSIEGVKKYGERFWRQYLDNPRIVGIRCVK